MFAHKPWVGSALGLVALSAVLGAVLSFSRAHAAGLLIADGGFGGVLKVEEQTVKVVLNNGIAVTEVTQVFRNTENRQVEALYTFPVPKGASVANFSMWIDGKEMVGEVLEKQRAREIYESYKRTRRDPGLLEQTDYKTFEMRIFPIGPGAQQKVLITYYQELDFDHDWATYVYPLATASRADLDARTEGKFAITFEVKSEVPIVQLESPSHGEEFVVAKHTDSYHQASLETREGDLNKDVVLAYQVSRPHTGIDVIASRDAQDDGYLCLTLTAGQELEKLESGMDYVFILDISGSMAYDGKMKLSRESIGSFINELGKEDRLEVITFNVTPLTLFGQLQPVTEESQAEAARFLASQQARGGTVLNPAITTAYRYAQPDRPLNVVVLSDGMTEQREQAELLGLIRARPANARVFTIGVGNEVNRPLLSQLADDAGGLAAFISRNDNFERQAKAFRRKLMRPAANDLEITFHGGDIYDIQPRELPNLYHGAPVRLFARYRGDGLVKVQVKADVNGSPLDQTVQVELPKADQGNPQIERMWAWHKVQGLLREADRNGSRESVVSQVVELGEEYSIVTEHTSFIVLENDAEYARWKIDRRNVLRLARDGRSQNVVRVQLDALREKAIAELGPTSAGTELVSTQPAAVDRSLAASQPAAANNVVAPAPAEQFVPHERNLDFSPSGGGGGAIDPITGAITLGLAGLGYAARRRIGRRDGGKARRSS